MTREQVGRIAFSALLGILWAMILAKNGGNIDRSILFWFVCILIIGISLNTQDGESWKIMAAGSIAAATVMIATLLFKLIVGDSVIPISGVPVSTELLLSKFVIGFGVFLWSASAIGALVACLARPAFLSFLGNFIESQQRLMKLEGSLNALLKVIGTLTLVVAAIL